MSHRHREACLELGQIGHVQETKVVEKGGDAKL